MWPEMGVTVGAAPPTLAFMPPSGALFFSANHFPGVALFL